MSVKISIWPTIFIIISAFLGILLGYLEFIKIFSHHLITPLLMLMLWAVFLAAPLRELGEAFKNYRFTLANVAINFLWTPILAYLLGKLLLSPSPELWLGFIMLLVTPCTDWYLIFTGLSRGNVVLGASILPLNLILQLILLPFYMIFLGGSFI